MDGVAAVRQLLRADATLTALVPATKIAAGVLPQGTQAPYIAITSVSTVDLNIPAPGLTRFVTERVQVTVVAKSYPSQKAIQAAVKRAVADQINPSVDGITGVTVHTDSQGPDFMNADASLYLGSADFRVKYTEER